MFNTANAFEEKGELFVDIAAYRDPEVITALYLENLRAEKPILPTELRRYRYTFPRTNVRYKARA